MKVHFLVFLSADESRARSWWNYINILTHEHPAAKHRGIHSAAATNTASAPSAAATGAPATAAVPTFPKPERQRCRLPEHVDSIVLWTMAEHRAVPAAARRGIRKSSSTPASGSGMPVGWEAHSRDFAVVVRLLVLSTPAQESPERGPRSEASAACRHLW